MFVSPEIDEPLRVLLYADFRASHALGWLDGLRASGIVVRPVSSEMLLADSEVHWRPDVVGRARSAMVSSGLNARVRGWSRTREDRGAVQGAIATTRELHGATQTRDPIQILETSLLPFRLPTQSRHIREHIAAFNPDIVHALRIPYEGVITLIAARDRPIVVSSWGQDFSLQARSDPLLHAWLRHLMPRADGLHVDNVADISLAEDYGFVAGRPVLHAAGNFGIDRQLFKPQNASAKITVLYPRGRRKYVNYRIFLEMASFFRAHTQMHFIGVGLKGDPASEELFASIGPARLTLTPELERRQFAQLMCQASVVVSPATSDGTPNSLIEALASGAYVMAGAIPSVSSLLSPPALASVLDPRAARDWISELQRVASSDLLTRAKAENPSAVAREYDRATNTERVPEFYRRVLTH